MSQNKPTLYKIYYTQDKGEVLVYLGRTKQALSSRLRGHFFKKPMLRKLDLNQVCRIEYVELNSVADMYLYEIYYINKLKPGLNCDDLADDDLTIELPELDFKEFSAPILESWSSELEHINNEHTRYYNEYKEIPQKISVLRKRFRQKKLNREQFDKEYEKLKLRENELRNILYGR